MRLTSLQDRFQIGPFALGNKQGDRMKLVKKLCRNCNRHNKSVLPNYLNAIKYFLYCHLYY